MASCSKVHGTGVLIWTCSFALRCGTPRSGWNRNIKGIINFDTPKLFRRFQKSTRICDNKKRFADVDSKTFKVQPVWGACLKQKKPRFAVWVVIWVVVSNIFYFHPYLGKWSNFTHIFQMGWNHQLVIVEIQNLHRKLGRLFIWKIRTGGNSRSNTEIPRKFIRLWYLDKSLGGGFKHVLILYTPIWGKWSNLTTVVPSSDGLVQPPTRSRCIWRCFLICSGIFWHIIGWISLQLMRRAASCLLWQPRQGQFGLPIFVTGGRWVHNSHVVFAVQPRVRHSHLVTVREKINPEDWQVSSLGDAGFLQSFRVVSSDYGKPRDCLVFVFFLLVGDSGKPRVVAKYGFSDGF